MSKVITFSRVFPAYHPKKGQPTHFVEKLWKSLGNLEYEWDLVKVLQVSNALNVKMPYFDFTPKHHTIRAGNRWKVGDKFSPRVWGNDINPKSGKSGPYHSKQIIIAPDIEIVKVWDIELIDGDWKMPAAKATTTINQIAKNDGLTPEQLTDWFKKPFKGQIICWNKNIDY
jgi:hypothetical protein